jgi:hypothetical protein
MPLSRGGKEPGPRLQDAVTAAPAGANVAPEKPRYIDYGGVLIGLPTDPPPPNATFVDFVEVTGYKTVVGPNDQVVCTLPCSRWVKRYFGDDAPAGRYLVHLSLQSDELDPRARHQLTLGVPPLNGARVRVVAKTVADGSTVRGLLIGGLVGLSSGVVVGGFAGAKDIGGLPVGQAAGLGSGVAAGATLVGTLIGFASQGYELSLSTEYTAGPGTFDPTRSASTARYLTASKAASKPRVSVSPFGIGGTW